MLYDKSENKQSMSCKLTEEKNEKTLTPENLYMLFLLLFFVHHFITGYLVDNQEYSWQSGISDMPQHIFPPTKRIENKCKHSKMCLLILKHSQRLAICLKKVQIINGIRY